LFSSGLGKPLNFLSFLTVDTVACVNPFHPDFQGFYRQETVRKLALPIPKRAHDPEHLSIPHELNDNRLAETRQPQSKTFTLRRLTLSRKR
jgi:hypothetical protein